MKYSHQREVILDYVKRHAVHPTADMVYSALKGEYPNLSMGTVYRNLNLLSDLGELMKIRIADGSDRFDGRTDEHYHMVCEKCARVYDLELPQLAEEIGDIAAQSGHTLTRVMLTLTGECEKCKKSAEKNA